MDKRKLALLALAIPVGVLTAAAPAHADDPVTLHANLAPLNDSGASGTGTVTVEGTHVTVKIESHGLLAEAPHAQHFHIGGMNKCPTPDAADDIEDDGRLSTTETLAYQGSIKAALTTEGDTSPKSGLAVDRMPVADARGHVTYHREFEVSEAVAASLRAGKVVLEQHGLDYNGNGEYDLEAAGASDLDPALPAEATDPAVCGVLVLAPKGGMAAGGGGTAGPDAGLGIGALAAGTVLAAAAVGGGIAVRRRFGENT